MWDLWNRTPYRADRTIAIDKQGRRHWVVVVKGTFTIQLDGSTSLSAEQQAPTLAPVHRGDPATSSLLYDSDMVLDKPGTDIILNATAHAPHRRATTEVNVGLRLGPIHKVLTVQGDRTYERTITGLVAPSPPRPFLTLPIIYERAYGGYDATSPDPNKQKLFDANPVGVGVAAHTSSLLGKTAANVEYPGASPGSRGAAGFGAICSHWSPRRGHAGTYDAHWVEHRKPLLPDDFDDRFFMCAPFDQRIQPHLRVAEPLELVNLTPGGALRVTLPKVYLAFTTEFAAYTGRSPMEHRAKLHSLIIEPDQARVMLVWHTRLSCGNAVDDIDGTHIVEKPYV
jgi:hypothetical protein